MTTSGHTAAQRTDLQAQYTAATATIAAVPAGATSIIAFCNTQKSLLQHVVTKEGGAPLS